MGRLEFHVNVGTVSVAWNEDGKLSRVDWMLKLFSDEPPTEVPADIGTLVSKMKRYFNEGYPIGTLTAELLDQAAWTPFQQQVYRAILEIPHGETRTYGWVADRVGRRTATRAVGQALRNNPLPILIPCHRVVSVADLGGFMGFKDPNRPELDLKRKLQSLEQDYLSPLLPFMSVFRLGVAH